MESKDIFTGRRRRLIDHRQLQPTIHKLHPLRELLSRFLIVSIQCGSTYPSLPSSTCKHVSIAVNTPAHDATWVARGPSRARYRSRMLTALFSSRSITRPQAPQRYVRFCSGMACLCPHRLQVLLVSRSSIWTSSFPASRHLYV